MTAIWQNDGSGWKLLSPTGFPKEAALHRLVSEAPQLLPLAGSPQLVVLGREVSLGTGRTDILAVETTGRAVVMEVKLAQNAEARRAVVAQVLAYAAYLHGMAIADLEQNTLALHLSQAGHASIADAVLASDQQGAFSREAFLRALEESLRHGRFRLVLVLDAAPPELVRLVGYLQAVSDKLLIDLITVAAYRVNGSEIIVPQRVDPERPIGDSPPPEARSPSGQLTDGAGEFIASIETAAPGDRPTLQRLADWASALEQAGLVTLHSYRSPTGAVTLLPHLKDEGVGLVTIWNDRRSSSPASLSVFRTVFLRRANHTIPIVEQLAKTQIGQGNRINTITDELLEALTNAYRAACTPGSVLIPAASAM
jgi:hypothetical protein